MHRRRRNTIGIVVLVVAMVVVAAIGGVSTRRDGGGSSGDAGTRLYLPATSGSASSDGGSGRIINGTKPSTALTDAARWRSASLVVLAKSGSYLGYCGGTFVTRRAIVTAAHCIRHDGATTAPTDVFVTNGTLDAKAIFAALRSGTAPAKVAGLVPIKSVTVNPAYSETTNENDAAVILVNVDSKYAPTPLAGASEAGTWGGGYGRAIAGGGAWIGGWGDTDYSYKFLGSDQLVEAQVPIVSDAECDDAWGASFKPGSMLCAGVLDTDTSYDTSNGVDTCQGDSGGPLLAPAADGTMRLVGITSFGSYTCASAYLPGVYGRVDAMRAWIESIAGPASGTTNFPAPPPPAPAQPVAGGGAAAGAGLAITAPGAKTTVGSSGATQLSWTQSDADPVWFVSLRSGGTEYWNRVVDDGATSYLVGHANVRAGSSQLCVITSKSVQRCVELAKGAEGPRAIAGVSSASLRNGRLTLRGRVAASTRTVQVRVLVTGGRSRASSGTMRLSMRTFPATTSFSTTVGWSGRAPKRLKVVTQVKVGSTWKSFTSNLA